MLARAYASKLIRATSPGSRKLGFKQVWAPLQCWGASCWIDPAHVRVSWDEPAGAGQRTFHEDFSESFDGKEKRVFRVNAMLWVRRDPTTRNHAMDMGIKEQVLTPRVKDAEDVSAYGPSRGV